MIDIHITDDETKIGLDNTTTKDVIARLLYLVYVMCKELEYPVGDFIADLITLSKKAKKLEAENADT